MDHYGSIWLFCFDVATGIWYPQLPMGQSSLWAWPRHPRDMPRASTWHARGSCEKNQLGSGVRWNCGFPNVMISSALYVFHARGKLISHDLFMAPLPLGTSVPRPKFHQVPGTSLGDTRYGTLVQRYWYLHVRCQRCLGIYILYIYSTLWLFKIAMEEMAHRNRWFSQRARNLHLFWGFSMAMLNKQMVADIAHCFAHCG